MRNFSRLLSFVLILLSMAAVHGQAQSSQEPAFIHRLAEAAQAGGVDLVAAYVVPTSLQPLRYENKYQWFGPDGRAVQQYLKHYPVPGEPAIAGTSLPEAVSARFGLAAGAICYDYDYPSVGLAHARLGAGLIALPSSDWRGIDPIHTQMAAVRAIEGGFAILRSTRMGLSAGIDAHGRLRAWLSSNESPERLLLVTLPVQHLVTPFSRLGNWVVLPFALLTAYSLGVCVLRRLGRRRLSP